MKKLEEKRRKKLSVYKFGRKSIMKLQIKSAKSGERKIQMTKEKILSVKKENGEDVTIRYYIVKKAPNENEFGCEMYVVGIEEGDEKSEIENFSPDRTEAELLLENLYENRVSPKSLFSAAEVFITE